MATPTVRNRIAALKAQFDELNVGTGNALEVIEEVELADAVYNSNAIENSTLTLEETARIILEGDAPARDVELREIYEAKNLAKVMQEISSKDALPAVDEEVMLRLHRILMTDIRDEIAGRFRRKGELVRVGPHIGALSEDVPLLLRAMLSRYARELDEYFLARIARFHLELERIHPFRDGNGRIGRVLINYQLQQLGMPNVIIRNRTKQGYYAAFRAYNASGDIKPLEDLLALALMESFNRRITYLRGVAPMKLSEYVREHRLNSALLTTLARRQHVPAFRERGVWMIAKDYRYERRT